jgi:hypothetical protein
MMSHPERQELELEEEAIKEAIMQLRIVVKENAPPNAEKSGNRPSSRSQRQELAVLAWEPRRRRLGLKS